MMRNTLVFGAVAMLPLGTGAVALPFGMDRTAGPSLLKKTGCSEICLTGDTGRTICRKICGQNAEATCKQAKKQEKKQHAQVEEGGRKKSGQEVEEIARTAAWRIHARIQG